MVLFSLYLLIVIDTLLVQSLHSARWDTENLQDMENPAHRYQRIAFPESKVSNHQKLSHDNLLQIESMLAKVLHHIADPDRSQKRSALPGKNRKMKKPKCKNEVEMDREDKDEADIPYMKEAKPNLVPLWEEWSDWSPCSVSCGKGRQIRWKHCLSNCEGLQTEMEEKTCQLPACKGKIFGLINL